MKKIVHNDLNAQQLRLIDELLEFYHNPNRKFFVLSGQAGVGKTTCIRFFIERLKSVVDGKMKICLCAPTNKAVKVLSNATNADDITYKTIYSILGLRMMANGEFKELADSGECSITDFDLCIMDEGSMANTSLMDYMEKKTHLADTKIILIGDREQLPPVGEQVSPIWNRYKVNFELTEVMRHQNSILDFVQRVRSNPSPEFLSTGNQVHICREEKFMMAIEHYAKIGKFHTGEAKAIAWRNATVDWLNEFIRDKFEKTKSDLKFASGDRVVIKEPIISGDITIAVTDDEGDVISASVVNHTVYPNLKAWKLRIAIDGASTITAYTVHDTSAKMFASMLDAMKTKKLWKDFWRLKEAFHNVGYSYALTAHRSQGSSYPVVFVDAGDIMQNFKPDERTKCLYVACSRAAEHLFVFP